MQKASAQTNGSKMIDTLIEILCNEKNSPVPTGLNTQQKEDYFRHLCNIRPPWPVDNNFLKLQDQYLNEKCLSRGVVDASELKYSCSMALWQGDITRLNSDAIVNACNSALLGCFLPLHNCIDNVIHSNAGIQVRRDCHRIMQRTYLPTGKVVVTPAYNLQSRYIFHTVGPIIRNGNLTPQHEADLSECYRSCISKGIEMSLETIAFCCVSTGVYGYPQDQAAKLAVSTVKAFLPKTSNLKIIFNVFLDKDREYYERELSRED